MLKTKKSFEIFKKLLDISSFCVIIAFVELLKLNQNRISGCGAVGSALDWGSRGREFKSRHSDQSLKSLIYNGFSDFLLPEIDLNFTSKILISTIFLPLCF